MGGRALTASKWALPRVVVNRLSGPSFIPQRHPPSFSVWLKSKWYWWKRAGANGGLSHGDGDELWAVPPRWGSSFFYAFPGFRLRIPTPARENRAHRHPILPKPGKLGALMPGARSLASPWANLSSRLRRWSFDSDRAIHFPIQNEIPLRSGFC